MKRVHHTLSIGCVVCTFFLSASCTKGESTKNGQAPSVNATVWEPDAPESWQLTMTSVANSAGGKVSSKTIFDFCTCEGYYTVNSVRTDDYSQFGKTKYPMVISPDTVKVGIALELYVDNLLHDVIVVGICGDGTDDGTIISYIDPWPSNKTLNQVPYRDFFELYARGNPANTARVIHF